MTITSPRKPPMVLTLSTARTLAVLKQGLAFRPPAVDKNILLSTIRKIGLLQLDTINVVERSHYLVMLSRLGRYKRADLDTLHYPDHQLFEQWAHAACLIPAEDYNYFAPVIHARRNEPLSARKAKKLGRNPSATLKSVLAAVTDRGPVTSRDFEDSRRKAGTWWNHKPAKVALDCLFYTGHLMIERRINFHCSYNLTERVLPRNKHQLHLDVSDWQRWATLRSVGCLGIGSAHHIADYYRQPMSVTRATLHALERARKVLRVEVQDWREPAYMLPSDLGLVAEINEGHHKPTVTTLLSPFDNLISYRPRVKELFDFEYRSEMYTPLAKQDRKFGYYVMPILRCGRLVGRLDPKVDRKTGVLIVRSVHLEEWVGITNKLISDLIGALREFMEFHGCHSIRIERTTPSVLIKILRSKLR